MTIKHDDDDLTEVTWMHANRVDLVKKAANGYDFILAKSAADPDPSLFTIQEVQDLAKTAQEGNMTDTNGALEKDALDPDTLLEEPDVDASGDASDPGSAAWEAVDSARAAQAVELVVALQRLVSVAKEREAQEALVGEDQDDIENVWDLEDVAQQLDCILGVLAPFQVSEQTESEDRESDDAATTLVLKSGRTLSGANENNIRQAQSLLETVLSTLPAPVEDVIKTDAEEAPVSTTTAEPETEIVTKAEGDNAMVPVYDANGKLVGTAKATAIVAFADAPAAADPADPGAAPAEEPAAEPAPADAATTDPAAPAADPADGAVIPGTKTVQSPAPAVDEPVTKALGAITETLGEIAKALAEKDAENSDLAKSVVELKEQVAVMGRTPDDRRSPMLNGARGVATAPGRGSNEDEFAALTKAVEEAPDAESLKKARANLAYAEIKDRFKN